MLTQDEVRHIAKLAKINLTEADVERLAPQISGILDYFAILEEVDTEGVLETSQVTGLESVTRSDEIHMSEIEAALVNCTPHQVEDNSVKIPKIM
ncbi:Asp-tRNA(Asn)/Glu-tRNA(Gln) amidotransferase subunit GatC [bacterium]|nr:Asp-tRNA(Asn)/Glu-tRNA(Gln) amidotransferase subunit GatC [bacterium]NCQ55585.1 Asp-tRNA(Asn)/Glu-tRNA(Gln) amidotransferase subunit GatC [Candidatus Parcubacteria bacterium]NCS67410.1 Asp-tRNA(Asn)/Glu-tRNA(Gln) amidotransferase subunit GatC [Candidatus Peregrinibacteria bacterium]NCS96136.1 Asp-tRNA(Asn)/Glu-tRNA(Gln) amidotransferase subunit GatC [bacterium]